MSEHINQRAELHKTILALADFRYEDFDDATALEAKDRIVKERALTVRDFSRMWMSARQNWATASRNATSATGYAINPARDLAPRCAHSILHIKGKRDSGWSYAWIPALAPLAGSCVAAACFIALYRNICQ